MEPTEVLDALHREQTDAIELWRSLGPSDWDRPSLCEGWKVRDVAVHCIWGESGLFHPNVKRALAGDSGPPPNFDLASVNAGQIAQNRSRTPGELIAEAEEAIALTQKMLRNLDPKEFERPAWNPITPGTLGFYVKGRIWEWWTHNQDVRIPLRKPGGRTSDRTRPVVEVVRDGITGVFLPERSRGAHVSYSFKIGETAFTVRIDDGTCRVTDGFDRKATSRVTADPATFVLVGTRRISQMKAVLTGKFRPSGNPIAGLKFLSYFAKP